MSQPTMKQLDKMWARAVKLRAGMKSEYSRKEKGLHSHHILGKTTHRLRWDLDNGVCITSGEHKFIAHGQTQVANRFREWALNRLPDKGVELEKLKWVTGGSDRFGVYLYLKKKIQEYERRMQCEEPVY